MLIVLDITETKQLTHYTVNNLPKNYGFFD